MNEERLKKEDLKKEKKSCFTWFKNLNKGYKIAISILLIGGVAAAITVPTILAIENSKNRHIQEEITYTLPETGDTKIVGDFFSKNPYVFYVPVTEYNKYIPSSYMRVLDLPDDIIEFKNLKSLDPTKKAKLDLKTGELTYSSYSTFNDITLRKDKFPHQEISFPSYPFYSKDVGSKILQEGKSFTINLTDYNLKPIKDGNTYYLPLDVISTIDPTIIPCTAFYTDTNKVQLVDSSLPYVLKGYDSYPESFNEWCYDLFTFNIDLKYGLNGYRRLKRHNNEYFTFNKEGARKTFEPYKSKFIKSKTIEELDINFDTMIKEQLDDGGHSVVYKKSIFSEEGKLPSDFSHSNEDDWLTTKLKNQNDARNNSSRKEELLKPVTLYDSDGDGKNDIGYLYFESFGANTIEPLKKANESFNRSISDAAKDIKDVVIDISNNGGGSTAIEGVVLSWICDGVARQVLKDARDTSVIESRFKYDINDDLVYDEKDYLPSDVNIYILTDATFSAASQFTYDSYMYSLSKEKPANKNIRFIGSPHTGGSCSVTNKIISPTGFLYRLSSVAVAVNWNDYNITCDEPGYIDPGFEMNLEQILDRENYINPKIKEARK